MLHNTVKIIEKTLEQLKRDKDDALVENRKLRKLLKGNDGDGDRYKKFI